MKKETWQKMAAWRNTWRNKGALLHKMNQILTGIVMASYPALLVWLFFKREATVLTRAIIVPLDGFLIVTMLRILINAKRPYEVFDEKPLIPKETKGKSFPSRHVFSVFIIAMTFLKYAPSPVFGILLLAAGVFLAALRVLGGVHFLRDVVAGALMGIAGGLIGFYL